MEKIHADDKLRANLTNYVCCHVMNEHKLHCICILRIVFLFFCQMFALCELLQLYSTKQIRLRHKIQVHQSISITNSSPVIC